MPERTVNFSGWLNQQIQERGWSLRETGCHAGLSGTMVGDVVSGKVHPGYAFCMGIAKAFGLPGEVVLREAGLLPKPPAWSPERDKWAALFDQLDEEDREAILTFAEARKQTRKGKRKKPG